MRTILNLMADGFLIVTINMVFNAICDQLTLNQRKPEGLEKVYLYVGMLLVGFATFLIFKVWTV